MPLVRDLEDLRVIVLGKSTRDRKGYMIIVSSSTYELLTHVKSLLEEWFSRDFSFDEVLYLSLRHILKEANDKEKLVGEITVEDNDVFKEYLRRELETIMRDIKTDLWQYRYAEEGEEK